MTPAELAAWRAGVEAAAALFDAKAKHEDAVLARLDPRFLHRQRQDVLHGRREVADDYEPRRVRLIWRQFAADIRALQPPEAAQPVAGSAAVVFVVFSSSGSYSDYREWPTRGFLDKSAAAEWEALLVADHARLLVEKQALDEDAEDWWDRLSALKGQYDPTAAGSGIGDIRYRTIEVPLAAAAELLNKEQR